MSLTLVIAILFTVATILSLIARRGRTWWVLCLLFALAALINWARWFELM